MKKNIYKNRRDVARHVCTSMVAAMFLFPACSDYLDVVPDKSETLENLFTARSEAYNALARAYSYMPHEEDRSSSWLLGDEWVNAATDNGNLTNRYKGIHIMRRLQSADQPILGTWRSTVATIENPVDIAPGLGNNLYEGINVCNLFIDRIDEVHDMKAEEIADWKAQVLFLKAYYHFLLLRQYGPIAIMDKATSPYANPQSQFVLRSKIDACFNYIIQTMGDAIPALLLEKSGNDFGQVDRRAATAIKARVLVWRASPFYSGNTDYFDFYDPEDGKPFFPQDDAATTKAKWKEAEEAVDAAITLCEANGVELYKYDKRMWTEDINDARRNPKLDTIYDLRWVITDPWNKELIWGQSNISQTSLSGESLVAGDANIMLPPGYVGAVNDLPHARNLLGATYKMLERFYTKHGLPLDDDNTFNRADMYDITVTPDTAITKEFLGILQSNQPTIQLYLDREPRFYANLGITGGYWRGHNQRIATSFFSGGPGASSTANGAVNRFWTGIGVQKVVHPDSRSGYWTRLTLYPIPIIRLADLYLMKAEARNQYLDNPDGDVWAAINKVRTRAGIPTVEAAYTGSYVTAAAAGNHTLKEKMKDIILNERGNEFAFEGHRFWDMLRYRKAPQEFTSPVMGWNYDGRTADDFFQQTPLQSRMFTLRDNLWPLPTDELNKNSKLKQNPGW
ncbi:RagB/SusD domain-containing protein [Candidatus Symbiothrix dinenymphae]|nr:RagB/SusD domain-containing protein [Candidatus Symbiothrix dinenymphae]